MITLAATIERGASKFSPAHVLVDFHFIRTDVGDARLVLPFNYNPATYEHTRHSDRMAQEIFACALQETIDVRGYSDPDEFVRDLYDAKFEDNMTVGAYRAALKTFRALQDVADAMSFFIGGGNTSLFDRLCEVDDEVRSRYVTMYVRGMS